MILIYGKGKTGESLKEYFAKKNIQHVIIDDNDQLPEKKSIESIIVSPGVPFYNRIFKYAKREKVPIMSEIEFAYRQCDNSCEIIAITGTDGKTTTTSLLYETLKNSKDKNVYVGGNYGIPFVEILDKIDKTKKNIVILELSSFQIYSTKTLKPKVSIILNISTDHLDWHKKEKHYVLSKLKLLKKTDVAVLNYDDKCLKNIKKDDFYYFSLQKLPESYKGIYLKEYKKEKDEKIYNLIIKDDKIQEIQVKTQLMGLHNLQNIMATILTCYLMDVDLNKVIERIEKFKPLNHRLEFVEDIEGVKFYNDSKSTTVQAVEKAIESFDEKIVLIIGGINKGGDFSKLGGLLKSKVLSVFVIGRDKDQIHQMVKDYTNSIKKDSLQDAVKEAFEVAKSNKAVVLFSPGCASFDMFKNYADRGNKFKEIVKSLNGKK